MADIQTCEVESTLMPLNAGLEIMYGNTYIFEKYETSVKVIFL
jgi:hypothetical protein